MNNGLLLLGFFCLLGFYSGYQFVIFIGGLALHLLVLNAVIVFCSRWMSFTLSPFSPCISMGRKPVWELYLFLVIGGFWLRLLDFYFVVCWWCMLLSSGVYFGFSSHSIL